MINVLYLPELREMLAEHDEEGLREFCIALHPARTAEFMEGLEPQEMWNVLQFAELSTRAEIFGYFELEQQVKVLEIADPKEAGLLLGELPADERVDLLNEVPEASATEMLQHMPMEERRESLRLQAFEEGTAGSVMTTELAKLPLTMTVRQALEELGHQAEDLETIYYIYIVDEEDHLQGCVSCRQLVSKLGKPQTLLRDLIERDLVSAHVNDLQEAVAEKVARYDLLAIPVVDDAHRLVGIVTHDDILDVLREEATEDAHRVAAVDPLNEGYLETHWMTMTWKRGMWLVILFFTALFTAFALNTYQAELARPELAWIVLFIPLVISCGGNSGGQSAALIITALTMGDVKLRDWTKVVRRELLMGLFLGSFLGALGFAIAYVFTRSAEKAIVIPFTLLLVVTAGTLTGSLLPLVFRRLGLDPALMSTPFVTGIIDIVGIIVYMNVALLLL